MSQSECRWGILGTATIARKNWRSIRLAGNATVRGVASRRRERAEQYIQECQSFVPFDPIPVAFGSYEALLASDDIDAVYIPLPTRLRKEWVIRAARAGKHVMCEKPCGLTADDVVEMATVCRDNNVQFMDGVMFMHSARLPAIRQVIDDGTSIGQIKRITSQFSFYGADDFVDGNIRLSSNLEPMGVLGDLGWYNVRFTLFAMNWQMPVRLSARMLTQHQRSDSPDPVPVEMSAELFFDGGVTGSFYCSFLTEHQQWANVSGTRGHLHLRDFVLPFYGNEVAFDVLNSHFDINGCDFNMEDHTRRIAVAEYSNASANAQETNLFRRFSELALAGRPDDFWPDIAIKTQRILDRCIESARQDGRVVEIAG